jgi:hypothetical protein
MGSIFEERPSSTIRTLHFATSAAYFTSFCSKTEIQGSQPLPPSKWPWIAHHSMLFTILQDNVPFPDAAFLIM